MQVFIQTTGMGMKLAAKDINHPKSMLPINGKPYLEYLIKYLKQEGVLDIVLITKMKNSNIEDYFRYGGAFGVNITYFDEDNLIGTGISLKKVLNEFIRDDNIVIWNGSEYFDIDLPYLFDYHIVKSSKLTMALKYKEDEDFSRKIILSDSKITGIVPGNGIEAEGFIDTGIYVVQKSILDYIPDEGAVSFERDVIARLIQEERIYGLPFGGKYINLNNPEDENRALKKLPDWSNVKKIKAAFLDRDGVVNEDTGYAYRIEDLKLMNGVVPFLKELKGMGFQLIIVTNQAGIAKGKFKEEDYSRFQEALIKKLAEEGVEVLDSYYCPYHIEAQVEIFRRNSLCRKPGPGMILKAADKHFIDLNNSIMIGDRDSDRIKLPYLKTYLMRGGYEISSPENVYNNFKEIIEAIRKDVKN